MSGAPSSRLKTTSAGTASAASELASRCGGLGRLRARRAAPVPVLSLVCALDGPNGEDEPGRDERQQRARRLASSADGAAGGPARRARPVARGTGVRDDGGTVAPGARIR